MFRGLFALVSLVILLPATTEEHKCQEAVKRFFEFDAKADYESGMDIPQGSEITFVYESYVGLYKFVSQDAFDDCDTEKAKVFGIPGSGHRAYTLPYGRHWFALDDYCVRGRKLIVNVLRCTPCKIIYLDAPFGFEIFEKNGSRTEWMSKKEGHMLRLNGKNWELSVEKHSFSSAAEGAPDHPPRRAVWHHAEGIEFEILIHCDACEDDPAMGCDALVDAYCSDETYSSLMRMYCPRFCGFCDLMQNDFALTTKSIEIHTNIEKIA